jgi:hypothetical protein
MTRRMLVPLLASGLLSLVLAPRGRALEPYVSVTNCEQVEVNGQPAVRLTLSMLAKSGGFFEVAVLPPYGPTYPDTCTVLEGAGPPGWHVYRQADGNFYFDGPYVQANQSLDGFQLTLNNASCCKTFIFEDGLLMDEPSTTVCFENCLATPTAKASWGRLKATYR